ncbi:protein YhcF [Enterobacter cancerogenus]|nr:protein YhcF [Enterobacter cancerogenus]
MAVTRVSFPLNVSLAVESLKKLALTEATEFDGQATISVVYL